MRKVLPSRRDSSRSSEAKRGTILASYASGFVAKPVLYTPSSIQGEKGEGEVSDIVREKEKENRDVLFTVSYTHWFNSSISPFSSSGYRSSALVSPSGSWSLNAVFRIRIISALSLFTIVSCFLSHRTGTVNLKAVDGRLRRK